MKIEILSTKKWLNSYYGLIKLALEKVALVQIDLIEKGYFLFVFNNWLFDEK